MQRSQCALGPSALIFGNLRGRTSTNISISVSYLPEASCVASASDPFSIPIILAADMLY
jgi:hypothetical protein